MDKNRWGRAAIAAWQCSSTQHEKALNDAREIRAALHDTGLHSAYGWAALTCGRVLASRGQIDDAEVLLTEALGRFILEQDRCGEGLATAFLGLAQQLRGHLDRALELVLKPLSWSIYGDADQCTLHNLAAALYFARDEAHQAVPHLIAAHRLARTMNCRKTQATILGNLGVLLQNFREWELSCRLSQEAWKLELETPQEVSELRVSHLSNVILTKMRLSRYKEAADSAKEFLNLYANDRYHYTWHLLLNSAEAFALAGDLAHAEVCLAKAVDGNETDLSPVYIASVQIARAVIAECRGHFDEAIVIAKEVLQRPMKEVHRGSHETSALVLTRCYDALGQKSEARRWEQFANNVGPEKFFSDLVVSQIRSGLLTESFVNPLSGRELECLNLSARGQTSADIGLKLGITTRTVNFHFSNILRKLNAMNRQEAIAKAANARLLSVI